jgi:hypothetical protein
VHAAPNEPLARLVADLLSGRGWPVLVRSAGIPHMGAAAPHQVLVPEEHAAEARRVLERTFTPRAQHRRRPPRPDQVP